MTDDQQDPFAGAEIIHRYTRAQAIADGVLVDVSRLAREAGFRIPVAITAAVQAQYVSVPRGDVFQTEQGRLWDILFMLHVHIRAQPSPGSELFFKVLVQNGGTPEPELVTLKAICGPGDDPSPVLTVLLPDED